MFFSTNSAPAKVLPLGATFIFGGAGRARTYDDRIMSPGL